MLDRSPAKRHGLGLPVESALYGLEDRLVLPARDAPVVTRRALRLDWALRAGTAPIAAQLQAVLFAREAVDRTLARRALVFVVLGDVDEVALVEAALRLGI